MSDTLELVEQILARPGGREDLRKRSLSFSNLLARDLWDHSTGHTILCPVCQDTYVRVTNYQSGEDYDILHFEGECKHTFAFVFEFYKGNTSIYLVREPDRTC